MVFVVERYLPGLSRSDLLRGLSRLEQTTGARAVRYLGSTIVLGDEACFCQFEGPSEAAVAEANKKAGLPFDRIVPALTVTREGSTTMTVSPSIPSTVEMRRSRLLGLVVGRRARRGGAHLGAVRCRDRHGLRRSTGECSGAGFGADDDRPERGGLSEQLHLAAGLGPDDDRPESGRPTWGASPPCRRGRSSTCRASPR